MASSIARVGRRGPKPANGGDSDVERLVRSCERDAREFGLDGGDNNGRAK
jgi:hypothetical protein